MGFQGLGSSPWYSIVENIFAFKMFANLSSFVYFDHDYSAKIHYVYAGPRIQWMPDTFAPPTEKPSEVGQ